RPANWRARTRAGSRDSGSGLFFLPELAVQAIARVRQRVQALEGDFLLAVVTDAEVLRFGIQSAQRVLDAVQVPAFLAREKEGLFALHGVRSLISHVEGVARQIRIRRITGQLGLLLKSPERPQGALPLPQEALLDVFNLAPVHQQSAPG